MKDRKIIIPAAGKAQRFNGILKEFAPIDNNGTTALFNAVNTAVNKLGATHIVITTNEQKEQIHLEYIVSVLAPSFLRTHFYLQLYEGSRDLLDSIITGLNAGPINVEGGILLPDTIVDIDFIGVIPDKITFGIFQTDQPHRFSVLWAGSIWTKVNGWGMLPTYPAWGIVLWSAKVAEEMRTNNAKYAWYDEMFNAMIKKYGYETFPIHSYYDIGSINHYMDYLDKTL